tara:strand:- start:5887 stop:6027 length:141 start_codon:yes stop_codon:yes gene_type:complete
MSYTKRYIEEMMEQGIDVLHDNWTLYDPRFSQMDMYYEEEPNENKK